MERKFTGNAFVKKNTYAVIGISTINAFGLHPLHEISGLETLAFMV